MNNNSRIPAWRTALLSYLAAIALCMEMGDQYLSGSQTASPFLELTWNLASSLTALSVMAVPLFLGLYFMNRHIDGVKVRRCGRLFLLVNFVVAVWWLLSEGYRWDNSLKLLFSSGGQVLKSLLYVAGFTYLLYQLCHLTYYCVEVRRDNPAAPAKPRAKPLAAAVGLYRRHTLLFVFLLLLLAPPDRSLSRLPVL